MKAPSVPPLSHTYARKLRDKMSGTLLSLAREDIPTIVFLRRQKLMSFLKAKKSNNSYGGNGTGHAVTGG